MSRSLVAKEEEVLGIKRRFKEEKQQLENSNKKQATHIDDLQKRLMDADSKFLHYKQSVEQSPINVLRNELAQKQIEIVDLESKLARSNDEKEQLNQKYEKVKKDMIALKKQIDAEKEAALMKQAEELE